MQHSADPRQPRLIAEIADGVRRSRAGKAEMRLPGRIRSRQIGMNIGAMENIARAIGIDDFLAGYGKRRHDRDLARFIVPNKPSFTHGDATDLAALLLEKIERGGR